MKNDRAFQRRLLEMLRDRYPEKATYGAVREVFDDLYPDYGYVGPLSDHPIDGELCYLEEQGLITINMKRDGFMILEAKATCKGIDFIEDDGGLGAILNAVTVKFDADNFRSLIEQGLLQADLSEKKRSAFLEALRTLPGTALQTIVATLVQQSMGDHTLKTLANKLGINL